MKGFWEVSRPTVLGSLCVLIAVTVVVGFIWLLQLFPVAGITILGIVLVIGVGRLLGREVFREED